MSVNLFVYGTLRSDCGAVHSSVLQTHFTYLGPARVRGRLYELGGYPGLLLSDAYEGWVWGELYRLTGDREALTVLDDYEECSERFPLPHEYERTLATVYCHDSTAEAYAYHYLYDVTNARHIASGDYRQFLEAIKK